MGAVADAALAGGARVVGVIPESLMRPEVGHAGLTELHVVHTMHQRKQMMAELSNAFVAMPGGIGTFEELFEVWTWRHLGYHDRPIGLLDVDGYWSTLITFLRQSCDEGFMDQHQMHMVHTGDDVDLMLDWLASNASGKSAPSYSQI